MQEQGSWILMRHVAVNGHDVNTRGAKAFEHWLQFIFEDGEVSVDDSVIIGAGERGPSIDSHFLGGFATAGHLGCPAHDIFEHAVVYLPFAENLLDGRRGD